VLPSILHGPVNGLPWAQMARIMHDCASELLRIPLLGNSVNKVVAYLYLVRAVPGAPTQQLAQRRLLAQRRP
jgi:hypothetical protein